MMTLKRHVVLIYRIYLRRIKRRLGMFDMERLEEAIYGGPRRPVPVPEKKHGMPPRATYRGMLGRSPPSGRALLLPNGPMMDRLRMPRAVIMPGQQIADFVECAKRVRSK